MPDHVIETRALSKRFGNRLALDHLDLQVPRGSIHAIVGANGAGKSTLFRILLGFLPPSAGEAQILGRDSQRLTPADRERIGFVNEEHTLPGWCKVSAVAAMYRKLYARWSEATFANVLGNYHVSPEQKIGQLSRGERAGFNLALVMAQRPELLVLDEPTLGLDVVAKRARPWDVDDLIDMGPASLARQCGDVWNTSMKWCGPHETGCAGPREQRGVRYLFATRTDLHSLGLCQRAPRGHALLRQHQNFTRAPNV